jgi:hypothetical protein
MDRPAVVVGMGDEAEAALRVVLNVGHVDAPPLQERALATMAAATIAGFRYNVLPRWFRALSLGFTLLLPVALLPVGPAGLLGASSWLWTVIASLWLTVSSD